jgi:hypothetical protein
LGDAIDGRHVNSSPLDKGCAACASDNGIAWSCGRSDEHAAGVVAVDPRVGECRRVGCDAIPAGNKIDRARTAVLDRIGNCDVRLCEQIEATSARDGDRRVDEDRAISFDTECRGSAPVDRTVDKDVTVTGRIWNTGTAASDRRRLKRNIGSPGKRRIDG